MKQLIASYTLLLFFSLTPMEKDIAEQFNAAIKENKIEEVRHLINAGAHINNHFDNLTPLHVASSGGHIEIVKLLLKHGALVNAVDTKYANTSLHLASWNNHLEVVKLLVTHGAMLVMKNQYDGDVNFTRPKNIDDFLKFPEQIAQLKKDRQDKLQKKAFLKLEQQRLMQFMHQSPSATLVLFLLSLQRT